MARKPVATLAERMAEARRLATELNASTDGLNAVLERAEDEFASIGLGVNAYLDISTEQDREHDKRTYFGFAKEGSDWIFVIVFAVDGMPELDKSVPLLKASRSLRLEAAQ